VPLTQVSGREDSVTVSENKLGTMVLNTAVSGVRTVPTVKAVSSTLMEIFMTGTGQMTRQMEGEPTST